MFSTLLFLIVSLSSEGIVSELSSTTQFQKQNYTKVDSTLYLHKSGQLQLLGQMLTDTTWDLEAHTARFLLERGLTENAIEKMRVFLIETEAYEPWMETHLKNQLQSGEISKQDLKNDLVPVLNLGAKQWVHAFYARLNLQETRVLNAFLDEILSEGLIQWHVRDKGTGIPENLPYLAQSFSFVQVTHENTLKVHYLKTLNYLPEVAPDLTIDAIPVDYKFLNIVPPLLYKLDAKGMKSRSPGFYFTTAHFD